ncbi:MAG: TetR/AcrR family transcriptional regulator [Deltaproteobacteria bacterium]|nr:TetR/AcrR family transcriptional regulator [Deltaproteobacteria bacterium]MDQ3296968.1 TetR/AcrR family transcriptional regulator [Myxococcota bacterium]
MDKPLSRRERKKDKTRQALVEVASRLFAERGIYATRVEDITERSDLGKGAFYNYFESKNALIAELLVRGIELLHREYVRDLATTSQSSRIASLVTAHEAFFDDHPVYVLLFHQARGLASMKAGGHEVLTAVFVDYLRRTGELIVSPEDRTHIDPSDLMDVAALLLGAVAGHRSFRGAGGLGLRSSVVTEALLAGIPTALAARVRKPT